MDATILRLLDHLHAEVVHLASQGVADRLHGELRRRVRAVVRHGDPASDGGDVHDPAVARQEGRQQRAGQCDLSEHGDVELPTPVVEGQHFDRRVDRNAAVVDERAKRAPRRIVGDAPGNGGDVAVVSDVEDHWFDALGGHLLCIDCRSYSGEDVEPVDGEQLCSRAPDARGRSGHESDFS